MYEHQMELVRQDRAAVQAHLRALMAEANLLRSELLRGFVMSAEGGLLGRPISWKSMPADPGQWLPPARCRHSTLCLRALQLPTARPPGAAAQPLPMHSTLRASLTASAVGLDGQHGGTHMRTTRFPVSWGHGFGCGTEHAPSDRPRGWPAAIFRRQYRKLCSLLSLTPTLPGHAGWWHHAGRARPSRRRGGGGGAGRGGRAGGVRRRGRGGVVPRPARPGGHLLG